MTYHEENHDVYYTFTPNKMTRHFFVPVPVPVSDIRHPVGPPIAHSSTVLKKGLQAVRRERKCLKSWEYIIGHGAVTIQDLDLRCGDACSLARAS